MGDLYIKRGPRGIRELSKDPRMFSRGLHKKAIKELRTRMTDLTGQVKTVRWRLSKCMDAREKQHQPVS